MDENLLEIDGLRKDAVNHWTYRRTPILEDVSFTVRRGECIGIIGPNGAGKTTTFKCLLGFLRPDGGVLRFRGGPLGVAERAAIGFLPEQPYFYDHLTVRETLEMYAALYGLTGPERRSRVDAAIDRLSLGPKADSALRTLSKGNLQRVGVAQALLSDPELIVLDEPMSGLDPIGRRAIRELILSLRRAGTSIVFSSHILTDAEALCDRVAILARGKTQEIIALDERRRGDTRYELRLNEASDALIADLGVVFERPPVRDEFGVTLYLRDESGVRSALERAAREDSLPVSLNPVRTSLEESFLRHVSGDTLDP